MNQIIIPTLILIFGFAAGCETKSAATRRAQEAFQAGQQQALIQSQMQTQAPGVTVRGNVRNPVIPWTEDLTLAKTIVAAVYEGLSDPKMILVTRNGERIEINPHQLLRGRDMPMQVGDVVDLVP
jgi:hypothetical protein